MSDPTDPDDPPMLADLRVSTIRRENDRVDEEFEQLESQVDDLETDVDDLETELEDERDRADAAEKLLAEFRDSEREELLARIREANETVDDDEEVDLSALEDASVDQLETIAEMIENVAGTQPEVSNRGGPDLGQVDDGSQTAEDVLDEVAADFGLSRKWEQTKNGDFSTPSDDHGVDVATDLPDGGISRAGLGRDAGYDASSPVSRDNNNIAELVDEIANSAEAE